MSEEHGQGAEELVSLDGREHDGEPAGHRLDAIAGQGATASTSSSAEHVEVTGEELAGVTGRELATASTAIPSSSPSTASTARSW